MKGWESDIAFYLFAAFVTVGVLSVEVDHGNRVVEAVMQMLRAFA